MGEKLHNFCKKQTNKSDWYLKCLIRYHNIGVNEPVLIMTLSDLKEFLSVIKEEFVNNKNEEK